MLHFKQFDSSTRFYLSDFTSAKRRIYESFRFNYQMTLPHLYFKNTHKQSNSKLPLMEKVCVWFNSKFHIYFPIWKGSCPPFRQTASFFLSIIINLYFCRWNLRCAMCRRKQVVWGMSVVFQFWRKRKHEAKRNPTVHPVGKIDKDRYSVIEKKI